MAGFSDAYEDALMKGVFGLGAYPGTNATVYLSLSTAAPNEGGTVTEMIPARLAVPAGTWASTAVGTIKNNAALTFPAATADYGTASHFHSWSAATGGTMILWGSLATNQNIPSGGTVSFGSAALAWTLD